MAMTADQYAAQLQALLPPGAALAAQEGGVLPALLLALAQEFARIDARGDALLQNAFPDTTTELLSDWERVCGIVPANPDTSLRQQAVLDFLRDTGGSSIAYYINRATMLGVPVSIDQFNAAVAGQAVAGDPINGNDWPFTFRVNLLTNGVDYPAVRADITARTPAHEIAIFGLGIEQVEADMTAADQLFAFANYTLKERTSV